MTPLHWAARAGSLACAEWLLKRGADVNAETTSQTHTPPPRLRKEERLIPSGC